MSVGKARLVHFNLLSLEYVANNKQHLLRDASVWKGFSLFSKPLIHNSFFRSENWTAKCFRGIFYLMTIARESILTYQQNRSKITKSPWSTCWYLWGASERHKTESLWSQMVWIFDFLPILSAWVVSGRLCSLSGAWHSQHPSHWPCPHWHMMSGQHHKTSHRGCRTGGHPGKNLTAVEVLLSHKMIFRRF